MFTAQALSLCLYLSFRGGFLFALASRLLPRQGRFSHVCADDFMTFFLAFEAGASFHYSTYDFGLLLLLSFALSAYFGWLRRINFFFANFFDSGWLPGNTERGCDSTMARHCDTRVLPQFGETSQFTGLQEVPTNIGHFGKTPEE